MSQPHPKQECLHLAERLSEFLDGELPGELRDEIVAHFQGCADCVTFLESLRRTRNLGQFLPEVALSDEALKRLASVASRRLGIK